jgi:hypothetical protein
MSKENGLWHKIYVFFDKFEDKVRGYLSRRPILYTIIGGVAIVLFWRGIWHTADLIPWLTGPVSIIISVVVLLATGLFVSYFVGDMIIISGLHKDKKVIDKTEKEIEKEEHSIDRLENKIDSLVHKIDELEEIVEKEIEGK